MPVQWRPSDRDLDKRNLERRDRPSVGVGDLWLQVPRKGPCAVSPETPRKHRGRQWKWPLSETSHLHSLEACQLDAQARELLTRETRALRVNVSLHRTVFKS